MTQRTQLAEDLLHRKAEEGVFGYVCCHRRRARSLPEAPPKAPTPNRQQALRLVR
jgi:hypothetical protein